MPTSIYHSIGDIVIPLGFEPKTHSLEGCCSIQLSYRTKCPLRSGLIENFYHIETLMSNIYITHQHLMMIKGTFTRRLLLVNVSFNLGIFHSLSIYEYILNYAIWCLRLIFNLAQYHPYTSLFSMPT